MTGYIHEEPCGRSNAQRNSIPQIAMACGGVSYADQTSILMSIRIAKVGLRSGAKQALTARQATNCVIAALSGGTQTVIQSGSEEALYRLQLRRWELKGTDDAERRRALPEA